MIRNAARKTLLLAAATLSVGVLAVNCSQSHKDTTPSSDLGSVGLAITLPNGATVPTVHYSVKNSGGTEVRAGDIAANDPGATVSVVIGGLSAGTGYTVVLSATASDGTTCAGTSLPFAVMANMSTTVNVLLLCRSVVSNGTVIVNGTVDNCPVINSFTVSPLAVAPGGSINVNAMGSDIDSTDTVTYAWSATAGTATAGTFTAPTQAMTVFHCPATGSSQQTLTITVSDNVITGTTTPKCSTPATIVVSCGSCGNGVVDTGEACDPAASPTGAPANFACNSSCQVVGVCGNNVVQPGEQCDPPNGTTCDTNCQSIPVVCGNSILQPPTEQCDPPGPIAGSANTCSSTCQIVMPASSGGSTGSGGVTSSGGTTGSGGSAGAGGRGGSTASGGSTGTGGMSGGTTGDGASAACHSCEDAMCAPSFRCDTLTGSARTVCEAAVLCVRQHPGCAIDGDATFCYCGTADQDSGACTSGSANGPCIAAFEAADPNILATDTAAQRGAKFGNDASDTSLPLGRAVQLVNCDAGKCSSAATCGGMF